MRRTKRKWRVKSATRTEPNYKTVILTTDLTVISIIKEGKTIITLTLNFYV